MAKQTGVIIFNGRVGNVVGRRGVNGGYDVSIYQPDVNDAKTPQQVYNRAKLSLAAKVAGMLGTMGEQVNVANGIRASRRGSLVRTIYAHINDAQTGPELGSSLPLVRSPRAAVSFSDCEITVTNPTSQASGSIAYTASAEVESGTAVRYITCLLVYNQTLNEWRSNVVVGATPQRVRIYIPQTYAGCSCFSYGYVLGVTTDAAVAEATATMGTLAGTPDKFSISVDKNNVVYGNNLAFTQVESMMKKTDIPSLGV